MTIAAVLNPWAVALVTLGALLPGCAVAAVRCPGEPLMRARSRTKEQVLR